MNSKAPRRCERRTSTASDRTTPRDGSRAASRPRAVWITDPQALLAAMAQATAPARKPEAAAPKAVDSGLELEVEPPRIHLEEPPALALPPLREDERIGHRSSAGVVVIFRRRRAA